MSILAIVGTAGRYNMSYDPSDYLNMIRKAEEVVNYYKPKHVISGGAALSDHVAVSLFLLGKIDSLVLYLPAEFISGSYSESTEGKVANKHHINFTKIVTSKEALPGKYLKLDSLKDIEEAMNKGAKVNVVPGFKKRNGVIANSCDILLAFSEYKSNIPTTPGTLDTWEKAEGKTRICMSVK